MKNSAPATNGQSVTITPAVHLEFIQNQLENQNSSAVEEIEAYHRALFLHHHAVEWEQHRQAEAIHQERLSFLEAKLKSTHLELGQRRELVPVMVDGQEDLKPSVPWNAWEVAMFVAASLGILCLITFGVLNISFNLLESGFVTFRENPFRSYLWAALLPVGALAVKIGWDFIPARGLQPAATPESQVAPENGRPRLRSIYLWSCLLVGMLGVLAWAAAYASVYPSLSKGLNEQIASLSVFDNPPTGTAPGLNFAGAKWVDVITVAGQAVAEIFLSAVLGIYLSVLYGRHRPVRLVHDPAYSHLDQSRRRLEADLERERLALAQAKGHLTRLENQLSALVAYGKSMFHREAARRQAQSEKRQVILDQLSDHLRQHLENPDTPAFAAARPGSELARSNGR